MVRRISHINSFILIVCCIIGFSACCEDPKPMDNNDGDLREIEYDPIPYEPEIPFNFPTLEIPDDNPLTYDGINLGRHLFFDPILSADSTMSCAGCHFEDKHFQDNMGTSAGIDDIRGHRSSMSLLNIGFSYNGLFWDGRSMTLEDQALLPVEDPIELHNAWPNVISKLKEIPLYQELFRKAFGIENTSEMSKELAAKAIASFERIIIAGNNSKYTRSYQGLDGLSDQELFGEDIFVDNGVTDAFDGECSHCHIPPLFTINDYRNNGLDSVGDDFDLFPDKGRFLVTGIHSDKGKFKVPTLYNVVYTEPFMHDGRINTLEEVIDHYNSGGKLALNKDENIRPLNLNNEEKEALIAFLHTIVDTSYLDNPLLQNPF